MSDTQKVPSDIYPSLSYEDASAAIDWLCEAFGFTRGLVVPGEDGAVLHSELSLGTGVVMVSSSRPDAGRFSPRMLRGVNQALSVHIDDPGAHFARAKEHGAVILREIKDEEYGSRGYMAEDPEGHCWYFGTYRPGAYWSDSSSDS